MKRAIVLIMDGVGIGALPDAAKYGDEGSNTLVNLAERCKGLNLPMLQKLGLGNIAEIKGVKKEAKPSACFGKMAEMSPGKDSTSGHWELCGIILEKAFPTFPSGFPSDIITSFEKKIGHGILGNIPASGTEIIKRLGETHIRERKPIVYTSADSVFQVACHTDVFSLEDLYFFCKTARSMLQGEYGVARVIARPFAGKNPDFYRTKDRRDFSMAPPEPTLLDIARQNGIEVTVIGKVDDLFNHRGFDRSFHSVNNMECVDLVISVMKENGSALIVANFVQFDMDWGHRNDVEGFRKGLVEMDGGIERIIKHAREGDLIFITADHGNDPTTPSTDHSREHVPILAHCKGMVGYSLGTRETFADLAKTAARHLGIEGIRHGQDFLKESSL
ncbi:MAG: phosphopentomutase [candidate division WOR-3 bacterium]|nr:MAG: phosphopentomutase [candidate division WOR-3 bacterium]